MDNYTFQIINDIQIIQVGNLINEFLIKEILSEAQAKIDKGFSNFAVDLSEMKIMNSVGLNFLIMLKKRTHLVGGRVAIANAPEKVLHLLTVTKLKPMFYLTNSVKEALNVLAEGKPLDMVNHNL
ncbi:MAG: STAS domain-containing protein [Saprospiraceae bacterium]